MTAPVAFATDTATAAEVAAHLRDCDASFTPLLSERVDIDRYARRLCELGVRFEAWAGGVLVGFVAGYCNDATGQQAYISNVSVLPPWTGRGIAAELLARFVARAAAQGFQRVTLDVNAGAAKAVSLYARRGFVVTSSRGADLTMSLTLAPDASPEAGDRRPE
jgi:ribosomal protein S18 acetylase RimI-like enzyme